SLRELRKPAGHDAGVGGCLHDGEILGFHQRDGLGQGVAMKKLCVIFLIALALLAQETRREITNAAAKPEDDAKGLGAQIPDVYAVPTQFERVLILRFKFQTDLLAGLEKMV